MTGTGNGADLVSVLLDWGLVAATLGFELAAGLACHGYLEGRRSPDYRLRKWLQKEVMATERERLEVLTELEQRLSAASRAYAKYWADFRKGLSDGMGQIDAD